MSYPTQRRTDAAQTFTVERRCDRGELAKLRRTDEGYLIVEGYVAKPGILIYLDPDGRKVRELVTAENLHRGDSLETLKRKPVTLHHPRKDVGPRSVKQLRVGSVGEVVDTSDEGKLKVTFTVERSDAIKAVEEGTQQLSPGYQVTIDPTPGHHEKFGQYDAIQVSRRYNHLAIVDRARGGSQIRMRADAGYTLRSSTHKPHGALMLKFLPLLMLAGLSREDAEPVAAACKTEAQSHTDSVTEKLTADLATMTEKHGTLFDADKVRKDAAVTPELQLAAKFDWFDERADLVTLAAKHGVEDTKCDNDALRLKVARKIDTDIPEDAKPEYIRGVFSVLAKRDAKKGKPAGSLYRSDAEEEEEEGKPAFGKKTTDAKYLDNVEAARQKRLKVKGE